MNTARNRLKTTYLHLLFWLSFWIISAFAYPKFQDGQFNYLESFTYQFFYLFGKIILTYWTLFFLFPKLFVTRKYWTFTLLFLLSLVAASLLQRTINLYVYYQYVYTHYFHTGEPINYTFWKQVPIIQTILATYPPAIVALCAKAIYEWYKGQNRLKEAEKEQLHSELRYLQAQIHPHFFLNTLNNLYGLALNKSDETPRLILKLSDLMRYILYETNVSTVPLTKEIHHLQNYIELEKIRYKDSFEIFFKQRGPIDHAEIAPLLLLPFLENAFKHGFSESTTNAWISVDIEVNDGQLWFKLQNSFPANLKHNNVNRGLGLQNVKRRLALLYPGKHELHVRQDDDLYTVNLSLPKMIV